MASASNADQQFPTPAVQQEGVVEESDGEEIITVDDEGQQQALPVVEKPTAMTKTGSDGTIRIRRQRLQPPGATAPAPAARCCISGSAIDENEEVVGVFSMVNLPVEVARTYVCFF